MDVLAAYESILTRIHLALRRCDRLDKVTVLGVCKGHTVERIAQVTRCGVGCLGENYLSDARKKVAYFPAREWHFIGTVQSGKHRDLVEHFDVIQTVCREKDVLGLEKAAASMGRNVRVYIQYDPGIEVTKHGASFSLVAPLAELISKQEHLVLTGLMMMAPNIALEGRRMYFRKAKALFDSLCVLYPTCTVLSMGMSADFEVAIEEGATMVRIGTALFGERV